MIKVFNKGSGNGVYLESYANYYKETLHATSTATKPLTWKF
jgi:hypothetical protein